MDEQVLVEAAQQGDLAAFNSLIEMHQQRAYHLALRIVRDAESAADVTQEAFLKAFRRLHLFRGGSFRAWLLRIVMNACYDHLRRQRIRRALSLEELIASSDGNWPASALIEGPERMVLRQELGERLSQAIDRLPVALRVVLILSDVEGLSYPEIAAAMDIPLGTVKSRLSRARAAVRCELLNERVSPTLEHTYRRPLRPAKLLTP
ncbi:MAG: sigma-70 family RNA polymerase sigma factor [Anaerolineae bacterium]|nr:sigma-70 family RNA polymerase sigma factor [Anaerolineae bacterium]MDW8100055.1 sigma-70 family RNA polymerase sigma factor [Anaerolineae bacterium]